jgi:hypothetical protein
MSDNHRCEVCGEFYGDHGTCVTAGCSGDEKTMTLDIVFTIRMKVNPDMDARLEQGEPEAFREVEAEVQKKLGAERVKLEDIEPVHLIAGLPVERSEG